MWMLLAEKELCDLTGYVRPSAQVKWLQRNGWRFTVNALGKPAVAVAEFNRRMVGGSGTIKHQEPNWEAIRGPQTQT
jgi:hypothetical protein